MENMLKSIGSWLFLIGVLLSVIIGIALGAELWTTETWVATLLAGLGFIVGVLSFFAVGNITQDKMPTFLIAALMLVGIGATSQYFTNIDIIGPYLSSIAGMLAVFVAPAAGILAIRAIWDAGKTEDIEKIIPKVPQK